MVVLFITGALIFLIYNAFVASKAEVHSTQCIAILFRVISGLFFAYDVAGKYPAGMTLMIQSVAIRSFVDAFLYIPSVILYSKMVPHHIEGMMIGFIWSIIKLGMDVIGRLITVGLNLRCKVQGEVMVAAHGAAPIQGEVAIHGDVAAMAFNAVAATAEATIGEEVAAEGEVAPFIGFYKLYLI